MASELNQEGVKEIFSNFLKNGRIKRKFNGSVFDNKIRTKTLIEILISPGIHTRELQRRLGVSFGTVAWHVGVLERCRLIKSVKRKYYTSLYPASEFQKKPANIFINCPIRREILDYVKKNQGATQKEIGEYVGVHQSTTRHHLKKLVNANIVLEVRDGKQLRYFAQPHRQLQT
jgi:predicted transcriptional regulator